MFSFLKKQTLSNYNFLAVDMHNHLLPGIDDGLKTVEDSVAFIKELMQLGYKKFICTPHILPSVHNNSPETILPQLDLVREALAKEGITVPIEAAAEYMVGFEFHEQIKQSQRLLTFGKDYILIEMSFASMAQNIVEVIFDLKMKGLQPILAHPERYEYYGGRMDVYEEFIGRGALLQVNLLSLTGVYGKLVKKTAEKLLQQKMVSFIGTDMHHAGHLNLTQRMLNDPNAYKFLTNQQFLNESLLSKT